MNKKIMFWIFVTLILTSFISATQLINICGSSMQPEYNINSYCNTFEIKKAENIVVNDLVCYEYKTTFINKLYYNIPQTNETQYICHKVIYKSTNYIYTKGSDNFLIDIPHKIDGTEYKVII
jgi:hypothetical protein